MCLWTENKPYNLVRNDFHKGLWENIFSILTQLWTTEKVESTTGEDPEGVGDNEAKLFNPSKNTKGPNTIQRKVLLQLAQLCDVIMRTHGHVFPSTTPRPPPSDGNSAPKSFTQEKQLQNV